MIIGVRQDMLQTLHPYSTPIDVRVVGRKALMILLTIFKLKFLLMNSICIMGQVAVGLNLKGLGYHRPMYRLL